MTTPADGHDLQNFRALLGQALASPSLQGFLLEISTAAGLNDLPSPEIKPYPDALYANYFALGLSLSFVGKDKKKKISADDARSENIMLDSIFIYNRPDDSQAAQSNKPYKPYPLPFRIPSLSKAPEGGTPASSSDIGYNLKEKRGSSYTFTADSTGASIVSAFGEPSRRGGGKGLGPGSLDIWCEWTKLGLMVEFGGAKASGPKAWEEGKDAVWKVVTIYQPDSA